MIHECFDFATQRLGGSQITGIRAKDDRVAESFFAEASVSGLRPVTMTFAPAALKSWAVARPIPVVPPVIRMVLVLIV